MIDLEEYRDGSRRVSVSDPPLARFLFQSTGAAWLWLAVRLWVGWQLFAAGQSAFVEPGRLDDATRTMALYWQRIAGTGAAVDPGVQEWQRLLAQTLASGQAERWLAAAVAVSQLVLGMAILLGFFVGIAAAGGILLGLGMNILTGATDFTPFHAAASILLALAWKNAGFIGFDRYVLRGLGAPWWDEYVMEGGPRRGANSPRR